MNYWSKSEFTLPNYGEPVLIFNENKVITVGWRTSTDHAGENWTDVESRNFKVTHWMPLPEPPDE